ncbi:MAG TPA: EipA family protein [Pseudorhizobium sp.]|nr:EipA family protein [Pseudorhizobium sp.]
MRLYLTTPLARLATLAVALLAMGGLGLGGAAHAQSGSSQYSAQEIVDAGHSFFGNASGGLAKVVEKAFEQYGLPNGYVLGQEGSGAFIAGLTYGEGQLYTKNAGQHPVFWQGPSLGIDYGGQGSRAMMLVYDLPSIQSLYARYGGVSGSAFIVAGVGMTVLRQGDVVLVPIRTGVGARLGINVGYLKLTPSPTWNPF